MPPFVREQIAQYSDATLVIDKSDDHTHVDGNCRVSPLLLYNFMNSQGNVNEKSVDLVVIPDCSTCQNELIFSFYSF